MNRIDVDWDYLREDMLIPAITIGASVLLLLVASWFHGAEEALYAEYIDDQKAAHRDYDELVYRRGLVDRYYRRYDKFRRLGFVGHEDRLDWVESIRGIAMRQKLPHVAYVVEPQLDVSPPVTSVQGSGDIRIFGSKLELVLGLLHEGDLLRFFNALQSEAPGLMKIDRCEMARQSSDDELLTDQANVVAICKLTIFSLTTADVGETVSGA